MHDRAEGLRRNNTAADLDCLDRLQAHHGLGEKAVEPLVPVSVGAQARGHVVHHHLKDAANSVAGARSFFYLLFHAGLGRRVHAAQQNLSALRDLDNLFPGGSAFKLYATYTDDVAANSMPSSRNSSLAKPPAATREVDSRAEARSST